jgi:hypothetical protein
MIGQTRRLSSGVPVRAVTGRTLSHTWILTSGKLYVLSLLTVSPVAYVSRLQPGGAGE